MAKKYDFAGLATKANMKCTDGRTILTGAYLCLLSCSC